jgi:lipoate-protein ligase A
MTIDGKKFSGNAMYAKRGRVMHHGTLLFDSDLSVLSNALKVTADKIESKGVQSVRSRVTNIKPYLQADIPIGQFADALRDFMYKSYEMEEYKLSEEDIAYVDKLRDDVYGTWDWNYGASPRYAIQKQRRFENCGKIELFMDVKEGAISDLRFYGDFFWNNEPQELAALLKGCRLTEEDLSRRLNDISVDDYFRGLSNDDFLWMMVS